MATYTQLPGTLNLAVKRGDRFATIVDFDISLSGYTVTSDIVSIPSGLCVSPLAVDTSLADEGKVGLSLTSGQTGTFAGGTYRWLLRWDPGHAPRTALEGFFEVVP
jgi:hypothetical protein